jgi:hypothetical protein
MGRAGETGLDPEKESFSKDSLEGGDSVPYGMKRCIMST